MRKLLIAAVAAALVACGYVAGTSRSDVTIGWDRPVLMGGSYAASSLGNAALVPRKTLRMAHPLPAMADLHIAPYTYGWALDYPGVFESWVQEFSIHNNTRHGGEPKPARLWVGNPLDTGGLRASGHQVLARVDGKHVATKQWVELASETFLHEPGGDMRFLVRGASDGFDFLIGPKDGEKSKMRLTKDGLFLEVGGKMKRVLTEP